MGRGFGAGCVVSDLWVSLPPKTREFIEREPETTSNWSSPRRRFACGCSLLEPYVDLCTYHLECMDMEEAMAGDED